MKEYHHCVRSFYNIIYMYKRESFSSIEMNVVTDRISLSVPIGVSFYEETNYFINIKPSNSCGDL